MNRPRRYEVIPILPGAMGPDMAPAIRRLGRMLIDHHPEPVRVELALPELGVMVVGEIAPTDLAELLGEFRSSAELAELALPGPLRHAPRPGAAPPHARQEGGRPGHAGEERRAPGESTCRRGEGGAL